jgi:hypothetical protein
MDAIKRREPYFCKIETAPPPTRVDRRAERISGWSRRRRIKVRVNERGRTAGK